MNARTRSMHRGGPCLRRRLLALALACGLPTLYSGCAGGLLPKPPQPLARFSLDDARPAVQGTLEPRAGALTLVVVRPRPAPGYDSTRMVYLRRPQELESYAFHEWIDAPAQMLAPLLVRALQDSGAFHAVLLAPSAAGGALRLETELVRLHQDFGSQPSVVRLTLRAVLLDSASRQVVAWREFDRSVPADSDDPAGGVAAARDVTQQVLAALAAFLAGHAGR